MKLKGISMNTDSIKTYIEKNFSEKRKIHNGDSIKFSAECKPHGTSGVEWVVENGTGEATIDYEGKLTAVKKGTVSVYARSVSGRIESNVVKIEIAKGIDSFYKLTNSDYTIHGREESDWEKKSPPQNAFDDNKDTAYDGQSGGWCGIKLNTAIKIAAFRYMPRVNNEGRMVGTKFQVSDDGVNYTTIHTVREGGNHGEYMTVYTDTLEDEVQESLRKNRYKYFRFYSGDSNFSNIAEIELFADVGGIEVTDVVKIGTDVFYRIASKEDDVFNMFCASYDKDNILMNVDVVYQSLPNGEQETFRRKIPQDAEHVSVFAWSDDSMEPVSNKVTAVELEQEVFVSSRQNKDAFHLLPERGGKVRYTFYLTDNGSKDSGIMLGNSDSLNSSSSNYFAEGSVVIVFSKGSISVRDNISKTFASNYNVGERVKIEVEVNMDKQTYTLYVNGTKCGENVAFRKSNEIIDTIALVENADGKMFEVTGITIA